MKNCRSCKTIEDRKQCTGKDFFTYWDIVFCIHQIRWIISQFLGLDKDEIYIKQLEWPPDPSGKPDTNFDPRSKRVNTEASFCKPMEILGEVNWRLTKLGRAGERLVAAIIGGNELDGEMESALKYVSGWGRRKVPYYQWRNR